MARFFLIVAGISGLLAVALGAFGAHGLRQRLAPDLLAIYQTGVQYHIYHTLALLAAGVLLLHAPQSTALRWCGWLFIAGITIFSGSLYVLSITGVRWLGAITPLGGGAFLAGWVALAVAAWRWQ